MKKNNCEISKDNRRVVMTYTTFNAEGTPEVFFDPQICDDGKYAPELYELARAFRRLMDETSKYHDGNCGRLEAEAFEGLVGQEISINRNLFSDTKYMNRANAVLASFEVYMDKRREHHDGSLGKISVRITNGRVK